MVLYCRAPQIPNSLDLRIVEETIVLQSRLFARYRTNITSFLLNPIPTLRTAILNISGLSTLIKASPEAAVLKGRATPLAAKGGVPYTGFAEGDTEALSLRTGEKGSWSHCA